MELCRMIDFWARMSIIIILSNIIFLDRNIDINCYHIKREWKKTHVTWCTDSLVWFLCLCISRCTFKFLSEISYIKIKIQNPHFDIELIMNWVFVQILKHSTCVKCWRNMLLASYQILRHQSDWQWLIKTHSDAV